jgi:hypothetical protein
MCPLLLTQVTVDECFWIEHKQFGKGEESLKKLGNIFEGSKNCFGLQELIFTGYSIETKEVGDDHCTLTSWQLHHEH